MLALAKQEAFLLRLPPDIIGVRERGIRVWGQLCPRPHVNVPMDESLDMSEGYGRDMWD